MMGHHGHHATTLVESPKGQSIPIDNALAPLITSLWSHGYRTTECCQDDIEMTPGRAVIDFVSMPGAVRFVRQSAQRVEDVRSADFDLWCDLNLWAFDLRLNDGSSAVRVLFDARFIDLLTTAWGS